MASGGDVSGPDTAPSDPSDRPVLDVGLVVSPAALTSATLASDVTAALAAQYPQVEWNLVVVEDRLAEPPVTPLDLIETARDRMLDENWDLVLVLTDLPLKDGRRVVQTQLSPVHGVGLVVVPALGVGQVATKVRAACVRLVEELLHFDGDDTSDDIDRRARQRAEDVEGRDDENPVQFAARVLGGNVGVLLDGHSFQQLSDQSWSIGKIVESAWMTASLATLGGAVGAGLEEDDITRAAAYTRESDEG